MMWRILDKSRGSSTEATDSFTKISHLDNLVDQKAKTPSLRVPQWVTLVSNSLTVNMGGGGWLPSDIIDTPLHVDTGTPYSGLHDELVGLEALYGKCHQKMSVVKRFHAMSGDIVAQCSVLDPLPSAGMAAEDEVSSRMLDCGTEQNLVGSGLDEDYVWESEQDIEVEEEEEELWSLTVEIGSLLETRGSLLEDFWHLPFPDMH
jgi:hypothetical protein